jgi:hypothetical protein
MKLGVYSSCQPKADKNCVVIFYFDKNIIKKINKNWIRQKKI